MYDDILVPTDGSDTVSETITHAIPLAVNNDATIHVLYVVDNRILSAASGDTRPELEASLEAEGEAAVTDVAERAETAGLEVERAVRTGTPWKVILEYADSQPVDLIVIGTRGKSPREKITSLGSVSERVVDNAPIPVFVVRNAGST